MEELIKQNNAIDIYEEYFNSGEVVDHSSEQPYTKTLTVFRDPQVRKDVAHLGSCSGSNPATGPSPQLFKSKSVVNDSVWGNLYAGKQDG